MTDENSRFGSPPPEAASGGESASPLRRGDPNTGHGPGLSIGAGIQSMGAHQVLSYALGSTWTSESVAQSLGELPAHSDSWWSPHVWRDNKRRKANWLRAWSIALDADWHDEAGRHSSLPNEVGSRVTALVSKRGLPVHLVYLTPRGFRAVVLLSQAITDDEEYGRVFTGAARRFEEALRAGGIPIAVPRELPDLHPDGSQRRDALGRPLLSIKPCNGIEVDLSVRDLARIFRAPNGTVGEQKRRSEIWCVAGDPIDPAELVAIAAEAADGRDETPSHESGDDFDGPPPPTLSDSTLRGFAGEFVDAVRGYTEASDAALLFSLLTAVGCMMGSDKRAPCFFIGGDGHHARLFTILVGESSKARKGSSWAPIRLLLQQCRQLAGGVCPEGKLMTVEPESPDPNDDGDYEAAIEKYLTAIHADTSTLSTGEGLAYAIRDGRRKERNLWDPGMPDKRILAVQTEFGGTIRMRQRLGNTLADALRQAWDGTEISPRTKGERIAATRPHVCIVGHITRPELLNLLSRAQEAYYDGFVNRFMWVHVHRARNMPEPPHLKGEVLAPFAEWLTKILGWARGRMFPFDEGASREWAHTYEIYAKRRLGGVLDEITNRAEPYMRRLALIYAVLDSSEKVTIEHLVAAKSAWAYAEQSAVNVFGSTDITGEEREFYEIILTGGAKGMRRVAVQTLSDGRLSGRKLSRLADMLERRGLIVIDRRRGQKGGNAEHVYRVSGSP